MINTLYRRIKIVLGKRDTLLFNFDPKSLKEYIFVPRINFKSSTNFSQRKHVKARSNYYNFSCKILIYVAELGIISISFVDYY